MAPLLHRAAITITVTVKGPFTENAVRSGADKRGNARSVNVFIVVNEFDIVRDSSW